MFINTLSSSALFAGMARPRSPASSQSSSAFSSQHCTQSDTEAEEERRFMQRRVQRRQVMTPNAHAFRRESRKDFLTPVAFASCSTPKSSQEDLLFDDTSVYFRPLPKLPSQRYERRERDRKLRSMQAQQQKLLTDYHWQSRHHRNPPTSAFVGKQEKGSKTSQIARKRNDPTKAIRRRHSNPLMAFLEEDDEGRCSSPILLDFRASPESELKAMERKCPEKEIFNPSKCAQSSEHSASEKYAIPAKKCVAKDDRQQKHQPYSNLSPFLLRLVNPLKISPILSATRRQAGGRQSNSDSGMEERNTEEAEEWERQTQFENISGDEKIYQNLPPAVPEPPMPPSKMPPRPPAQGQKNGLPEANSALSRGQPLAEDLPALYGRLAAVAFVDARKAGTVDGKTIPIANARRIRLAQRQLADLVGLRLSKALELSGTLDSDENFQRKSADFGIHLAQKLRQTEAASRKEFNWQIKKLQKILHGLRTADDDNTDRNALQKIFKRMFNWK